MQPSSMREGWRGTNSPDTRGISKGRLTLSKQKKKGVLEWGVTYNLEYEVVVFPFTLYYIV